jgi:hypothetical protein
MEDGTRSAFEAASMLRTACFAFLAAGLLALAGQTASAQGPWGGVGYGGFGYGYGYPYFTTSVPTPPYFALHPPVYYSLPVPRTYGYSPFAYPGCVMTPELVAPETIINPHVQPLPMPKDAKPMEKKTSGRVAQVIVNPYFVPAGLAKQ